MAAGVAATLVRLRILANNASRSGSPMVDGRECSINLWCVECGSGPGDDKCRSKKAEVPSIQRTTINDFFLSFLSVHAVICRTLAEGKDRLVEALAPSHR